MPIINHSLLKNNNLYKVIRNWDDKNYWYIRSDGNTKLVVPSKIISSNFVITVCTEFEAPVTIVEQIYKELVIDLGIAPNRILLISENYDLTEHILNTAIQYNTIPIMYEWSSIFQFIARGETIKNLSILQNIRPKTNTSDKYFLNFNRRWRTHRPALVALLYASGLLEKGHVSLGPCDGVCDNWPTAIDHITKLLEKDETLIKLIKDNVEEIINLDALYLDTTVLNINRANLYYDDIDPHVTTNLYKDTAFSIVNETYFFDNDGRFITEKTFKPIMYHHPFVLVSKPFSLKLLRELGYKTFSPFIDESYDEEVDHVKRLHMILKEVERLCNVTNEEMDIFLKNVQSITEHNFERLLTRVPNIYKKL